VQQTIDRPTSHRRPGLPRTGGFPPRRPLSPVPPAPVRRPLPCRVEDPELWFADNPAQLEIAKNLCGSCPVRDACLAGALDRAEPWGSGEARSSNGARSSRASDRGDVPAR